MKRRNAIKNMMLISALPLIPIELFALNKASKPIHFVAVGDAGTRILEYIKQKEKSALYTTVNFLCDDTDLADDINSIILNQPVHKKYGKHIIIPDLTAKCDFPEELVKLFSTGHRYIIVAGLGGSTGTYWTKYIQKHLANNHLDYEIYCSLPFRFEGKTQRERAMFAHKDLLDDKHYYFLELEETRQKHQQLQLVEAFYMGDISIHQLYKKSQA
ncbi:hypothetical protein ACT3CE_18795 [Marinifilum sp. RC60d5]|uniref:hypothetical protein n=1 Tax=Marinifilum sp. RC60d5 TaxID=3458414 RepID=UPI0040351158